MASKSETSKGRSKSDEGDTSDAPSDEKQGGEDAAGFTAAEAQRDAKPTLSIEQFLSASGRKADQLAGFVHHARAQGLRMLPFAQWQGKLDAFDARTIN